MTVQVLNLWPASLAKNLLLIDNLLADNEPFVMSHRAMKALSLSLRSAVKPPAKDPGF